MMDTSRRSERPEGTVPERSMIRPEDIYPDSRTRISEVLATDDDSNSNNQLNQQSTSAPPIRPLLLELSSELIDLIFSFLSPSDLDRIGCTCRLLNSHSKKDGLWRSHVQNNVPVFEVKTPKPFSKWRELFRSHDPHWFLTKHKVWFSDYFMTGRIIVIRYNAITACFDGFRLVAERGEESAVHWALDPEVIVHFFNPRVKLHKDVPALCIAPNHLSFDVKMQQDVDPSEIRDIKQKSILSIHRVPPPGNRFLRTFELCRPIPTYPSMNVWPPKNIPAPHRVRSLCHARFHTTGYYPTRLEEVSDQTFRIKNWVSSNLQEEPEPNLSHNFSQSFMGRRSFSRINGEVGIETFGTVDPYLYTPTTEKPFRGLWIGDYPAYGSEFLLMHQPNDEEPFDIGKITQRDFETEEEWRTRQEVERTYHGRLEAIKLTGDPNIFRGEYSFIADDIGEHGLVRISDDIQFHGARVVRCRGHIAQQGMREDQYIPSELIMISPDKLAQHWVGHKQVSFFKRINIDKFLDPETDPSDLSSEDFNTLGRDD